MWHGSGTKLGYDLVGRREPEATAPGGPNEIVGVLELARYGHRVAAVVRVDGCGENYVRVADGEEVPGASIEPLPVVEDGGAR